MKSNLWIWVFVGLIILVFIYLQRKDKLEFPTGIASPKLPPGVVPGVENGIKDLPDYLPGTDIPVGLRPRPTNGLTGYIPHIDDPIWLREYYGLGEVAGLSPFARRKIEGFKWF